MNTGQAVFAQLMEFIPTYQFQLCVDRYHGNRHVKDFSCWDQFLCLAFAQLTYRTSLRNIETCLRAQQPGLYHMGFRGRVSRATLADANETRDWRIYHFTQGLIGMARDLYRDEPFGVELSETVYAFDSTTIDLCLSLFPWGQFRRRKSAVKLHTLLDVRGSIPTRANGVMVSTETGRATPYALENLQERGVLFVGSGESVYEGQVVGEHCRDNDLPVNICREKKLTNIRSSTAEIKTGIKPPRQMALEIALEYIEDDELVEVTPKSTRLRKVLLKENDRKKHERQKG